MKLGIPVYDGVNLLDVAGPLEMFTWVNPPDPANPLESMLLSEKGNPVTSINNARFHVHGSFDDAPSLDVIWVPGGDPEALSRIMSDPQSPYLNYLKQIARDATWVCSVCEGAMLLAQAGLLDGHRATTHWAFVKCLQTFPEIDVDTSNPRFLVSGNRLTGGGISSGLDESLKLISLLYDESTAEQVQRTTQYMPDPPVDAKLPGVAPPCQMTLP